MGKRNLQIVYNEETKKFCVIDMTTNIWETILNMSFDLETAKAIKKAFELGYETRNKEKKGMVE